MASAFEGGEGGFWLLDFCFFAFPLLASFIALHLFFSVSFHVSDGCCE